MVLESEKMVDEIVKTSNVRKDIVSLFFDSFMNEVIISLREGHNVELPFLGIITKQWESTIETNSRKTVYIWNLNAEICIDSNLDLQLVNFLMHSYAVVVESNLKEGKSIRIPEVGLLKWIEVMEENEFEIDFDNLIESFKQESLST